MSPGKRDLLVLLREKWPILLAALVCTPLLVFAVTGVISILNEKLEEARVSTIERAFNSKLEIALQKTETAVAEGTIDAYIASNDSENTSSLLNELARKYDLTTMVAVNEAGVAVARVPSPRTGDYVSKTIPWGQSAAEGRKVVMVGEGRNFPLIINSAVPLTKDSRVVGALYGGYILDDEYARTFKQDHLKPDEEIAWYSINTGLYGTSFASETERGLLKIYFNTGSDWIQSGHSELGGTRLRVDGKTFHIGNILLKNPEGRVGGMLVFLPVTPTAAYVVAGGIIGILFLVWTVYRMFLPRERLGTYHRILFTVVLLSVLVSIISSEYYARHYEYRLSEPPYTIYNSTIGLVPDSDLFSIEKEQRIAIQITTGGEAINAAEATILFDPALVNVEDILMVNSFCDQGFILEKHIDNAAGSARIACGKPNGFIGERAILADLIVQPLRTGKLTLQFGDETRVFAHDGLGTDVLRSAVNGTYQIIGSENAEQRTPLLFSRTHPNSARWYNKKNIRIDWSAADEDRGLIYVFNQIPRDHSDQHEAPRGGIDLAVENDGVYYFHLFYPGFERSHFHKMIRIDTTPPALPIIRSSATNVKAGEVVRFDFESQEDDLSGIQKNFYVQFDGGLWLPTLPQMYVPFLEAGEHTVVLRVFDNAENFADSSATIMVK